MVNVTVANFVPEDRRHANWSDDPREHFDGTGVFVDVVDFTGLTENHLTAHGRKLGAEQLYQELIGVMSAIQAASQPLGGVAVAFAGDGATLYFDAAAFDSAQIAATQAALFAKDLRARTGTQLRVTLASGPYWRRAIGDPALGLFEIVGGPAAERLARLDTASNHPGVLICAETAARLAGAGAQLRLGPVDHSHALIDIDAPPAEIAPSAAPLDVARALEWVPYPLRGVVQGLDITEEDQAQAALEAMAQLRIVTAAFFHVRGLTPETADAGITSIQRRLSALGGTVLALNTDAKGSYLSCVFGAPIGQESDPQRALIACLQEAEIARKNGMDLGVGVARGSVLTGIIAAAGRARYDVTGQAMSHAARLMVQAPAGVVLVEPELAADLSDVFEFASDATSPTCGTDRNAGLRLIRRIEGQSQPVGNQGNGGIYVERDAEQQTIAEHFQQNSAAHVVIEAAPGLGKSTLLAHACRTLAEGGFTLLTGTGEEMSRALPYHAWRRVALGLMGEQVLMDTLTSDARGVLTWLAGQSDALPDTVSEVAGPERAARIAEHLATALGHLAQSHKVILCFDDQHWMDTSSNALALGIANAGVPVGMILARRPEPPTTMEAAMLLGAPGNVHVGLAALSENGLLRVAAHELGAATLTPELRRLLIEKSGGSPLFAQQIGRVLRDQGLVTLENGHAMVAAGAARLDRVDFLTSVESAILARFDRLDETSKRVAYVASIHGRSFSSEAVEVVLGAEIGPDGVAQALATLEQDGYIVPTAATAAPVFTFGHALVQDAIHDSLTFALRQRINSQLARWWAQRSGAEAVARRARHQLNSLSQTESDPGILSRTIDVLEAAAAQAGTTNANLEASQFQEQAMDLASRLPDTPETRRKRFHLMTSFAYSLALFRGYGDPTVEEAYRNALTFSETVDEVEDLAFTLYGLFSFYASRGDYADSATVLDRMTALAAASQDPKMPSFIEHTQSIQTILSGHPAPGADLAVSSIDKANALGDGMFFSHSGAGDWRIYSGSWAALGHMVQGNCTLAQRIHETARNLGQTDNFARAFVNGFAPLPVLASAPQAALTYATALVADADARGFALFSIIGRIYQGWAAARLGHNDDRVGAFLGGQLQISQAMKLDSFNPFFLCLAAEAHLALGNTQDARASVEQAQEAIARCGASVFAAEVLRAEAQVVMAEGADAASVAQKIAAAIATANNSGAHMFAYLAADWAVQNGVSQFEKTARDLRRKLRDQGPCEDTGLDGPLAKIWAATPPPTGSKTEKQNA